jgi:hypothetical protein
MDTIKLELLPKLQCRVLKKIVIISTEKKELGTIIYTRELTDKYEFIKQTEIEFNPNNSTAKETYPSDYIDNIILESIKVRYPESYSINDTLFFKSDLQKIKILTNLKIIKTKIIFQPFIAHLNYTTLRRTNINSYQYNLNIYTHRENESGLIGTFFINYDFNFRLEAIEFE